MHGIEEDPAIASAQVGVETAVSTDIDKGNYVVEDATDLMAQLGIDVPHKN